MRRAISPLRSASVSSRPSPGWCRRCAPREPTRRWPCAAASSGALAQQALDRLALLEPEQPLLAPEAAAVAAELAALVHDTVAGDHDRDAVHAVGGADRAHRVGRADLDGDVLIRAR